MKRFEKPLKILTIVLGIASSSSFMVGYLIFENLRPRMVQFEAITAAEENSVYFFGIGLLIFAAFCLLSLFRTANHLKNVEKVSLFYLFLLGCGVVSLVFIFGDLALLSDIGKQYRYGLSQPEWVVLYILMAFQFLSALVLTYVNLFKLKKENQVKYVARDSNIFIIAQYVGVICGLMGLSFISLNFLFTRSLWMVKSHALITSFVLLVPYVLIVGYWFIVKLQEKTKEWYDEKQMQDIGRSSFLTLILSIVIMGLLFILNFNNLDGMLSVLWFPFYAFLTLFMFSLGNLYFSRKGE